MPRFNRRSFLRSSLAAATVTVTSTRASGRVAGANDTIQMAVAGLHGRGKDHLKEWVKIPGVRVTYLIDPDTRTFKAAQKILRDAGQPEAKAVRDVREALNDKNVDTISIATPNHWHALMAIWACQAGKDVYVEKPCSHNVHEGRLLVEAARKHQRIVQHGTQRRGSKSYQNLAAVVRSEHYGKLQVARGLVYKLRPSIGTKETTEPPAEVDFNLWLGPAAKRPYHGNLVHYNWHWFWDFGNGDIGNQGVHQMDIARWMIPNATLPRSVMSLGGRFGYRDQAETPNSQLTQFDYGDVKLIFEVRGLATAKFPGDEKNEGSVLHFADGYISNFKFFRNGTTEGEPIPSLDSADYAKPGDGNIFKNFIACVKSRKVADQHADVEVGHFSSALCHLANVSYRLGTEDAFSRVKVSGGENGAFGQTLEKFEEHLAKMGPVNLAAATVRVGKQIVVDAGKEEVINEPKAAALLTRQYRSGFAPNTV